MNDMYEISSFESFFKDSDNIPKKSTKIYKFTPLEIIKEENTSLLYMSDLFDSLLNTYVNTVEHNHYLS